MTSIHEYKYPCKECLSFYSQNSSCYRIEGEIIKIEDPTIRPSCCPQDDRKKCNTYHDKFPYYGEYCKGCIGDCDNSVQSPGECNNGHVRPQYESDGQCPFWSTQRDYNERNRIYKTELPKVSQRIAELICNAVNNHDFTYWKLTETLNTQFEITHHRILAKGHLNDDYVVVQICQVAERNYCVHHTGQILATHAEIKDGWLNLDDSKMQIYKNCIEIEIVDSDYVSEIEIDEEEESESCERKEVETKVIEKPIIRTLETWS